MRPAVRMALATATTLAVALPLTGPLVGSASAAGHDPVVPSQAQIQRAKQDVADKAKSVKDIEAALAAATARMEAASVAAETAAEKYNGAMWELTVARKATLQAKAQQRAAVQAVAVQRAGIVQLVTESYQNGTQLNTATALMGGEGPQGLMNRYGVVQSAGDSMDARYERFRVLSARAAAFAKKTAKAEAKQTALTADAKKLAAAAGQAAANAGAAANEISNQKQQLVQALAKAQNISVALATQRQKALEEIARRKAAEARRAHELAVQAAAKKAAEEAAAKAAQQARQNKKDHAQGAPGSDGSDSTSSPLPPVSNAPVTVSNPAPNEDVAVQRAIDYAKAQLGKPYQWAATGPNTFDCSGLTMQAWARGGKLLPHYSVAQFAQSTPISMADAKPGDLLFWSNNGSPSGIHHVALYLGGGQFIEAPHTGANVRYNSIYNWYPDFVARP